MSFGIALELLVTASAALHTIKTCTLNAPRVSILYIMLTISIGTFVVLPIPAHVFRYNWPVGYVVFCQCGNCRGSIVFKPNLNQKLSRDSSKRFGNVVMVLFPNPAFNMFYVRLDRSSRMILILVLPIIKLILKNLLTRTTADLGDCVLTLLRRIDFFNTIYQPKCLQGSKAYFSYLNRHDAEFRCCDAFIFMQMT